MESVILCTTVWTDKEKMREAYTQSEFDWLVVEVNALWRRKHRTLKMKSKWIPFFCRLWNTNMVDKSELAWHRQQDLCSMYSAKKDGLLKMFPVNGAKDNSDLKAVFTKYNIKLMWQNGGKGEERPQDEPSVEEREEELVEISSDASSGDSAYMSHPPMKRKKDNPSVLDHIAELRRKQNEALDNRTAISARKGKGQSVERAKAGSSATPSGKGIAVDRGKGGVPFLAKPATRARPAVSKRPRTESSSPKKPGNKGRPGGIPVPLDNMPHRQGTPVVNWRSS